MWSIIPILSETRPRDQRGLPAETRKRDGAVRTGADGSSASSARGIARPVFPVLNSGQTFEVRILSPQHGIVGASSR
jgi:hypothetical protein